MSLRPFGEPQACRRKLMPFVHLKPRVMRHPVLGWRIVVWRISRFNPKKLSLNLIGSRTRSGGREPLLSRTSVSYRVAPYSYRIRIVDHISYRFASHPYRIHIVSASYRIVSRAIVSYRVVSYRYRYRYRIVPCRYRIVFGSYPYRLTNHCIVS